MFRRIIPFLGLLCLSSLAVNAEKRALLIGIGDYPVEGGWHDLASGRDLEYVREALLIQGVADRMISDLKDEAATYQGILDALNQLQEQAQRGDIVFVHFSGHGQQVWDKSGDEVDKLDEALVPYDADKEFQKGIYEGSRHLTDDEILKFNNRIRKKLGPTGRLIWTIDACHSGSGVRARTTTKFARGSESIMMDPSVDLFSSNDIGGDFYTETSGIAPMACYSASSAHEPNYEITDAEGKQVGSLSYCFAKEFLKHGSDISTDELFLRIQKSMNHLVPNQRPQWEGTSGVSILLNSTNAHDYIKWKQTSKNKGVLTSGQLHGMTVGSIVALENLNENKVIAKGEIIEVGISSALVELEKNIVVEKDHLVVAKEVKRAPPKPSTTIGVVSGKLTKDIENAISKLSFVTIGDCNPDLMIQSHGSDNWSMTNRSGIQVIPRSNIAEFIHRLAPSIKQNARMSYLRAYENELSHHNVGLTLVDKSGNEIPSGSWVNSQKEYNIKLTNLGRRSVFYGVLGIDPDDSLQVIVPMNAEISSERRLSPGAATLLLKNAQNIISDPGQVIFKLFTQDKPLSWLKSAFDEGDANYRGGSSPFGFIERNINDEKEEVEARNMNNELLNDIGVYSAIYFLRK